ncbi:MAG: DEAD/DEAH box helicase [Bacteroidota bacterium]
MKFTDLELAPDLLYGIQALGFEETTPIQEAAIPLVLDHKDIIACAQTGTGKTAAFLIPTIHKLMQEESAHSRVLIVVPTRELALQIDQNVDALSYFTGISSVAIYGGKEKNNWDRQNFGIKNGADILVATPGRLLMHISIGNDFLSNIDTVILDEADKMLDMGFYPDILNIIRRTPADRQTLMFSATMPKKIRKLAKEILGEDPEEISLNLSKPAEGVTQLAFMLHEDQKIPMLEHLIKTRDVDNMIIFASSKISVDRIASRLQKLNYGVKAIHSDKSQEERQQTLREFRNKQFPILIGTDVLARGIDIDNLSHVLNYDVPHDAEDYVHRVGRTARASSTGEAITFITPSDAYRMVRIENLIEMEVPKPDTPEEIGETPTYNPKRGGGGRGRGRGGRGRGGNHPRGGGRGGQNRNRRRGGGGGDNRNRSNNGSPESRQGNSEGGERSNNRKRRRPKRRNGGGQSKGPSSPSGEKPTE